MFLPLVDQLRCPNPHDETWLVASIDRADARDVLDGFLGCPKCLAEYPIRGGIVRFADDVALPPAQPSEKEALRLAAALDLTDPTMTAVLQGAWGAHAAIMRGMTPSHLLLVNPPAEITSGDGVSIVHAHSAPIARGTMHAAAFDGAATDAMVASLVASLRGGGRLLGPVASRIPEGLRELTRDAEVWVAASEDASGPIQLERRRR